MAVRKANATWNGGLKGGKGSMALQSGAFEGAFSFSTRFEEEPGTNPEELVAAAHAGCFSMAFSAGLERNGTPPTSVNTTAKVHLTPAAAGGFEISKIELETVAVVPGLDDAKFQELAAAAKAGCPVSKLYAGGTAEIVLSATLAAE